jgi:hypothetical protein
MKKVIKTKTGAKAPASGQYRPAGTKNEITLTKGEKVPPYKGEAKNFKLVDKTKHKS